MTSNFILPDHPRFIRMFLNSLLLFVLKSRPSEVSAKIFNEYLAIGLPKDLFLSWSLVTGVVQSMIGAWGVDCRE